jgi:hypothetical protein
MAAPPTAETESSHSACTPPTLLMAKIVNIKIKIRNIKTRLLLVLGSSLTRLAKWNR